MSILPSILTFLQAHTAVMGSVSVWMAASLLFNFIVAIKGPAGWAAWAEKNQKVAFVANLMFRYLGIDLVSIIEDVQAWLKAQAALKAQNAVAASTPTEKK